MPDWLLARYFKERGVLAGLDFTVMKETKPEQLSTAWLELPEDQRNAMDANFREIYALSCEKGWCAIRDEAQWQFREAPNAFTVCLRSMHPHPNRNIPQNIPTRNAGSLRMTLDVKIRNPQCLPGICWIIRMSLDVVRSIYGGGRGI